MEPIVIKVNPEIELKTHDRDYAETLFSVIDGSREFLREWLPWVDNTRTVEDSKNYIESSLESFQNSGNFDLGIWYKKQLVGCIGIHDLKKSSRSAAIGYWLSKDFVGEGIMSKSVKALIDYLFGEMKLNRVEIRCGVKNEKSCAVAERLGFTFEGVSREGEWVNDHFHDLKVYSMLEKEWKS